MALSRGTVETLIDLVEIKLSCVEVYDRDDARELARLEQSRRELLALIGREDNEPAEIAKLPRRSKGRSRAAITH
jgi:hypothetical protein